VFHSSLILLQKEKTGDFSVTGSRFSTGDLSSPATLFRPALFLLEKSISLISGLE
jgi:hypothetical protein